MRASAVSTALLAATMIAGCGHPTDGPGGAPGSASRTVTMTVTAPAEAPAMTAATTRLAYDDPVTLAAAVARLAFSGRRADGVVLVDRSDWRGALAASFLAGRDPILLTEHGRLPSASRAAIAALHPRSSITLDGAPSPRGLATVRIGSADQRPVSAALARFAGSPPPRRVIVASADRPRYATIAAGLSAAAGIPILLSPQDALPAATRAILRAEDRPRIYMVGPAVALGANVEAQLRALGTVTRIAGRNPVGNAIAFARYTSPTFGWGASAPGRGLIVASANADPQVGPATAALAATGGGGPLLLLGDPDQLDATVGGYLTDIRPPARRVAATGPYNHAWIVGRADAVSPGLQNRIEDLMEMPSR